GSGLIIARAVYGRPHTRRLWRASSECVEIEPRAGWTVSAQVISGHFGAKSRGDPAIGPTKTMSEYSPKVSRRSASAMFRLAAVVVWFCTFMHAQTPASAQAPLTDRERALLDRIEALEKRVAALEGKPGTTAEAPRTGILGATATGAAAAPAAANVQSD